MAKIVDPDLLTDGTEIDVDETAKTIQLLVAGNLTTDGVTIKAVYSKLKELWKTNTTYIKYPFPMGPITDEQFEMINGWDWKDDTTRYLLRDGGWALKDSGGISQEEWAGIISLGSIQSSHQAYFLQSAGGGVVNFQLTGPVNQAIKVYGDVTHGNFDYRSYLKIYCRVYQYSYAFSQLSDIGVSTLTYQAYRFPLANAGDIKITHDDTTVDGQAPYTGMTITWHAAPQQRSIGGVNRNFHIIIDGNQGTAEQIYEYVQRQLRKATDIDAGAGTQLGQKVASMLRFVGDTLYTILLTEGGVFIDDYQSSDINRLVFVDDTGTERTFPYTATLTVNFGDNLKNDANAKFWVYFTSVPGGDYGDSDAILVNTANVVASVTRARASNVATIETNGVHGLVVGDGVVVSGMGGTGYNGTQIITAVGDTTHFSYDNTGSDEGQIGDTGGTITQNMSGKVNAASSIQKTFAYDTNAQGGRTPATDADVTAVAIGLSTAQFVKATGTIARSTANSASLVAALERNYQNPA